MNNKEKAVKTAQELFVPENIQFVGQGFYRYSEPIANEMISRKGLEREASKFFGKDLTLVTRNDVTDSLSSFARKRAGLSESVERITVLQLTADYEADQERAIAAKAKKLQTKYAK